MCRIVLRMSPRPFDLEDRLVSFAATACKAAKGLPRSATGRHVTQQLVRSATAPFANYGEARAAESRRDFVHKLKICLKELREVLSWLKFIDVAGLSKGDRATALRNECDELIAIFVTSIKTASKSS
jgi:four helix bundle protein